MARLGVRVDLVAAIRETKKAKTPDPVAAAVMAEQAGADGIVCHLREDRVHIKEKDVYLLREVVKTHFNLLLAPSDEMLKIGVDVLPDMITFVPEKHVPEGAGLDVATHYDYLQEAIDMLRTQNIVVNIAIEPDVQQVKAAARLGTDFVELQTSWYAHAGDLNAVMDELEKVRAAGLAASKLGLGISASGGLHYQNVVEIARIPHIEEINVGHAVISRALMQGMDRAVRDMLLIVRG